VRGAIGTGWARVRSRGLGPGPPESRVRLEQDGRQGKRGAGDGRLEFWLRSSQRQKDNPPGSFHLITSAGQDPLKYSPPPLTTSHRGIYREKQRTTSAGQDPLTTPPPPDNYPGGDNFPGEVGNNTPNTAAYSPLFQKEFCKAVRMCDPEAPKKVVTLKKRMVLVAGGNVLLSNFASH